VWDLEGVVGSWRAKCEELQAEASGLQVECKELRAAASTQQGEHEGEVAALRADIGKLQASLHRQVLPQPQVGAVTLRVVVLHSTSCA
jgi:hypothetical protein